MRSVTVELAHSEFNVAAVRRISCVEREGGNRAINKQFPSKYWSKLCVQEGNGGERDVENCELCEH